MKTNYQYRIQRRLDANQFNDHAIESPRGKEKPVEVRDRAIRRAIEIAKASPLGSEVRLVYECKRVLGTWDSNGEGSEVQMEFNP